MPQTEAVEGYVSSYNTLSPTNSPEREGSRTSLLDLPPERGGGRSVAAGAGAVLVHAGVVLLVLTAGAQVTRHVVELEVSKLIEVELPTPTQGPEPEPVEEPPPPTPKAATAPTSENTRPTDPETNAEAKAEEPPPAPAESGEVLTAEDEVVDFGDTIISGNADHFAGGLSSADGTSKSAVRNPHAQSGGVVGGTGKGGPVRVVPPPVDHSRAPRLAGGVQWNCPFPAEANMEQIDQATVSLQVQVAADGNVQTVNVLSDPGYGFGREAQRCARRKRWDPGIDKKGAATGALARIKVRFQR